MASNGFTNNIPLPQPPITVQLSDQKGMITPQWAMWIQQLYLRIGGSTPVDQGLPVISIANSYALLSYLNGSGIIIPFYQSPIGINTILSAFTVKNNGPADATISAWIVPYQQVPSSLNLAINAATVVSGDTASYPVFSGVEIGSGAYVVVQASIANSLLCTLTGRQIT